MKEEEKDLTPQEDPVAAAEEPVAEQTEDQKKIEELTCIRLDDIDSLLSLRLALLCRSSLMIEEEE